LGVSIACKRIATSNSFTAVLWIDWRIDDAVAVEAGWAPPRRGRDLNVCALRIPLNARPKVIGPPVPTQESPSCWQATWNVDGHNLQLLLPAIRKIGYLDVFLLSSGQANIIANEDSTVPLVLSSCDVVPAQVEFPSGNYLHRPIVVLCFSMPTNKALVGATVESHRVCFTAVS